MLNLVFVGNLGGDPETNALPSGDPVTNFSVAVNRRWKNRDGETEEETTWIRVAAFGGLAEVCGQYLSKGREVVVVADRFVVDENGGPRVWTDRNGDPRASFEVVARQVKFGAGGDNGNANGRRGGGRSQAQERPGGGQRQGQSQGGGKPKKIPF